MTTGVRIAQKRKELGLSQEQLGEQLGVSRQSIYKWESDAALPEVEKLVALSKLYSVTVGWLLGIEDESKETQDGELTETQLRMVEEIAARYQPVPDREKIRRLTVVAAVAAAVIAVVFITLLAQASMLRRVYDTLREQVNNVQNMQYDLESQLNDLSFSDTDTPTKEQQEKITSSCDVTVKDLNLTAGTVTFTAGATPKTYTEGMEAVFIVQCNGKVSEVPAELGDGKCFSTEVTCPLTDDLTISVAFISDGTRQTEVIDAFYSLYSDSTRYTFSVFYTTNNNLQLCKGIYTCDMYDRYYYDSAGIYPCPDVTQVRMGLFCDKKLVKWLEQTVPQYGNDDEISGERMWFKNDKDMPFEKGHSYTLVVVTTDEKNRDLLYPAITYTADTDRAWCESYGGDVPLTAEQIADWSY